MAVPPVIGVLGLGLMGSAISSRLLSQGFAVHGYDPAKGAGESLRRSGLILHDSLPSLARAVETVLLSLPNGSVSEAVCLGPDGIAQVTGSTISTVIDTTTTRPREAEHIAHELRGKAAFYDVGLSGSSRMISEGVGLAMVGGPADRPAELIDAMRAICDDVASVGGSGYGMRAKLAINLVLGLNRLALAEALVLGEKMDMDTGELLDLLQRSAAGSKAMGIWGRRMVDGHFTTPTSRVSQHTKDVGQMLELGEQYEVPMLGATTLAMTARVARASGFGELDNSVVIEVIRSMAGLPVRREAQLEAD